jgi:hypothetical protein
MRLEEQNENSATLESHLDIIKINTKLEKIFNSYNNLVIYTGYSYVNRKTLKK